MGAGGGRVVRETNYKSERAGSLRGPRRKALEGQRGVRRERGCQVKADPSLPTTVTRGACGSPKPRRGQGRHVTLDLVRRVAQASGLQKTDLAAHPGASDAFWKLSLPPNQPPPV